MQITRYLSKVFRLKKDFANLKAGECVYCFGFRDGYYFILLPKEWLGVTQVKMTPEHFSQIINEKEV